MTHSGSQPTYVHDQGQIDLRRLVGIARASNDFAREACRRADLQTGGRALDVGCGPLGALPVLAELVGPTGVVVGVDSSGDALDVARSVLADDGLGTMDIKLVPADINTLEPEDVCPPGPFDLAFCRLVLMHQPDPVATLRRMARLVRPGGRIVVQDQTEDTAYPFFDPPVPAVRRIFELHLANRRSRGAATDVAYRYPAVCRQAGLELLEQRGYFSVVDPGADLSLIRGILLSTHRGMVERGLTTNSEVESLLVDLQRAEATDFRFQTSPLMVEMLARVV